MLIPAQFEEIDLSGLPDKIREKLTHLHHTNELFYASIKKSDIGIVRNLLDKGYPQTWSMAMSSFWMDEQHSIDTYHAPEGKGSFDISDLDISFENTYRYCENIFNETTNRELVELLAQYYFKRNDFFQFKAFYFSTATDMALAQEYLKISLQHSTYPRPINGLLYHKDSAYGDLLLNADLSHYKKHGRFGSHELEDIFRASYNRESNYNLVSYKNIFDKYLNILIEGQFNAPIAKRVVRYEKSYAINSVFEHILHHSPEALRSYIYDAYSSLTGIHPDATPIAIAYSNLKKIDIFFELEWESMNADFKEKYPKQHVLSKSNAIRRKNFIAQNKKKLIKCIKEIPHPDSFICESCESLGMPEEYYPELAMKNKLENLLPEKCTETIKKI